VNGPERQTPPFNRQTPSTRFRPKAGDDAARPRASAVPKNHQNAPPTDAETSRRCIMQAKKVNQPFAFVGLAYGNFVQRVADDGSNQLIGARNPICFDVGRRSLGCVGVNFGQCFG